MHYRFINLEGQSWNERPVPTRARAETALMSREWDRRAENQGGLIIGISRRLRLVIFVGSIGIGVSIAWLAKAALGL